MPTAPQSIFEELRRLKAAWPKRGWSFDNRFQCVASSFDTEFAAEARKLLATLLPNVVNERSLASASPWIQEIATRTGGIRSTQLILSGNVVGGVAPYGLWWPWDESQTISLRIGLEGATMSDQDRLADCFGAMR